MQAIVKKNCEYCGNSFTAKRKSAKYCSNACRTKAYRKRNGIPFPDFSQIITSRNPSAEQRQQQMRYDELNAILFEENAAEKKYLSAKRDYDLSLDNYRKFPTNWSRDNSERRKKEFFEVRNVYSEIKNQRIKLEKLIKENRISIEREKLQRKGLVLNANDIKQRKFEVIRLNGKWKELLGRPSRLFSMIIYGKKKSGKTTFALQLAEHLKEYGSVLYIGIEDKFSFKMQHKLQKLDISDIDISRAKNMSEIDYVISKGSYHFVFIDDAVRAFLTDMDIEELKQKYQSSSIIAVYLIREGFGNETLKNALDRTDIRVRLENGMAYAESIFKRNASIKIFNKKLMQD